METLAIYEAQPQAIAQYNTAPIIEAYLQSLDLKPRSKETYKKGVSYFFEWVEAKQVSQPKRADILAYKEELTDKYTASTASSYLTAVRSFFNFLNAEIGYPNIALNVKNPKSREGHRKDALSREQVIEVFEGIGQDTLKQKRDYAIIKLLAHTGLRTIEVIRANIEDIRSTYGTPVLYVWGKGRDTKDEYVKLTPSVLEAIKDYLNEREGTEGKLKDTAPLFASVSRRDYGQRMTTRSISRICKQALTGAGFNDTRLTAHSFRHTAVSLPLQAGVPIREVQLMARHASPLTTERYAHDMRRLEDAPEDKIEELLAG